MHRNGLSEYLRAFTVKRLLLQRKGRGFAPRQTMIQNYWGGNKSSAISGGYGFFFSFYSMDKWFLSVTQYACEFLGPFLSMRKQRATKQTRSEQSIHCDIPLFHYTFGHPVLRSRQQNYWWILFGWREQEQRKVFWFGSNWSRQIINSIRSAMEMEFPFPIVGAMRADVKWNFELCFFLWVLTQKPFAIRSVWWGCERDAWPWRAMVIRTCNER